ARDRHGRRRRLPRPCPRRARQAVPARDARLVRARARRRRLTFGALGVAAVRNPTEYEERLERYLYERSEEWRAVRVGEKEVSEQAEIVRRYADLFSRDQLDALREAEEGETGDTRELLYRLRKTCEGGLISAELAEREDELENRLL